MNRGELLSMLLASLQLMKLECDTAHWQAEGLHAYADHLMYERISTSLQPSIDALAERIVGLHTKDHVNLSSQLKWMVRLEASVRTFPKVQALNDLLGKMLEVTLEGLTGTEEMTPGLEDLLTSIAAVQEENSYLLKQRFQGQPQ